MREIVRDPARLEHILECIGRLFDFTRGVKFEEYVSNSMMRFAVIKNLEIIGEASYMLTKEFRERHPEIEWRDIIDLRHVLVHGYYHISDEMVWQIIHTDLEPLKAEVERILREENL